MKLELVNTPLSRIILYNGMIFREIEFRISLGIFNLAIFEASVIFATRFRGKRLSAFKRLLDTASHCFLPDDNLLVYSWNYFQIFTKDDSVHML